MKKSADESSKASTPEERFVEFQYAEMKELTNHFLTLIAGTLVLTLTLAEQLLGHTTTESARDMLGYSWAALIAAFVFAGAGLTGMFFAALAAREGMVYGFAAN